MIKGSSLSLRLSGYMASVVIFIPLLKNVMPVELYLGLMLFSWVVIGINVVLILIKRKGISISYFFVMMLVGLIALMLVRGDYVNEYGFEKIINLMQILVLFAFFLPLLLQRPQVLMSFVSAIIFLVTILSIILIVKQQGMTGRSNILDANPIWLARVIGYGLVSTIIFLITHFKRLNLFTLFSVILFVVAMFLTGSRGPLISSMGVALIVLMLQKKRQHRKREIAVVLIILGALTAMQYIAPPEISERFSLQLGMHDDVPDKNSRTGLYHLAYRLLVDHPNGVGVGGFSEYHRIFKYPHNIILEIATETGIILGLFATVVFILYFVFALEFIKSGNVLLVLVASLFIYEFMNSLVSGDVTSPRLLYSTMVLIPYYSRQYYKRRYNYKT